MYRGYDKVIQLEGGLIFIKFEKIKKAKHCEQDCEAWYCYLLNHKEEVIEK